MNHLTSSVLLFTALMTIGAGCTTTPLRSSNSAQPTSVTSTNGMEAMPAQTTSTSAMMMRGEGTPSTTTSEKRPAISTTPSIAVDEKEQPKQTPPPARAGVYTSYETSKLADAKDGKVILFFYAPWCPTCRAVEQDINASLTDIPNNVTILKTDYQSSTELKRQYGVTYQHTFVQVDAKGQLIHKWSGSPTLSEILSNIQ